MTAPDPRLDEIQARLAEVARLQNSRAEHSELDAAVYRSQSDVAVLLAELRKAHEALAEAWEQGRDAEFQRSVMKRQADPNPYRAAVAAAKGDREHVPGSSAAECPCQECRDCCATFTPPKGDERG